MNNIRLQIIENSNLCNYYKEFLIKNQEELLPDTPEWKNNLNYMVWIHSKHRGFRKMKGYPCDCYASDEYNKLFLQWLREN